MWSYRNQSMPANQKTRHQEPVGPLARFVVPLRNPGMDGCVRYNVIPVFWDSGLVCRTHVDLGHGSAWSIAMLYRPFGPPARIFVPWSNVMQSFLSSGPDCRVQKQCFTGLLSLAHEFPCPKAMLYSNFELWARITVPASNVIQSFLLAIRAPDQCYTDSLNFGHGLTWPRPLLYNAFWPVVSTGISVFFITMPGVRKDTTNLRLSASPLLDCFLSPRL